MPSSETLIIVDLQCAFSVPPGLVAAIRRYMGRFEFRVFTRFENPPGSLFRKLLKIESCPPGSSDMTLLIRPEKRDVVLTKRGYGLGPGHIRKLKRLGVKQATVCGIDTDACVLGVMFSLFDAGIDCRAKPNLCWSSNGLQREGLKIIQTQFPKPRPSGGK